MGGDGKHGTATTGGLNYRKTETATTVQKIPYQARSAYKPKYLDMMHFECNAFPFLLMTEDSYPIQASHMEFCKEHMCKFSQTRYI